MAQFWGLLLGLLAADAAAQPVPANPPASIPADADFLTPLAHPSPQVRLATLERLPDRDPSPKLLATVAALAETDDNLLVRGRARILLADWSLTQKSDKGPAENVHRPSVRSDRIADETSRLPPRIPPPASPARSSDPRLFQRPSALPLGSADQFGNRSPGSGVVRPRSVSPIHDRKLIRPVDQEVPDLPSDIPPADDAIFLPPPAAGGWGWDDPLFAPRQTTPELGFETEDRSDRPGVLGDASLQEFREDRWQPADEPLFEYEGDEPLGFSGRSGVLPTEDQESAHFVPVEDRWRVGIPPWDRYATPTQTGADAPFELGEWWNPYRQHVLKGDYPIVGQHTFLNLTATSVMLNEFRQVPTPTTPFESTVNPFEEDFFGNPNQYFFTHYFRLKFDLFHGNAAFKPVDWRVVAEPVFNMNYLDVGELGIVNTNVRAGTTRFRDYMALEQWFVEAKLADLSPHYDFLSIRAGSQPFVSDFRGFIFSDINRAVRIFGTREANRDQFNLAVFSQQEKDTNSGLNTFHNREQTVLIGNYYRQDFIFPGYTAQASVHYNHDAPSFHFDKNNFLVRPDPTGIFQEHQIDVAYLGFAGEGHIERFNIAHAFYWALGRDSLNPLASQPQNINGQMAAVELSYDRDWVRFRGSYFFSSGDDNINDNTAQGFDAVFDNPNFAGGQFSYWQRQAIRLFGVNLVQRESLIPNLRSSKTQGQSNFVNPGLNLLNLGMDFEVTPKLRVITNANYLWFDTTEVLEQFVFQSDIHREIGVDLSLGTEYRPLLNDNVILIAGVSTLLPGRGFKDLYEQADPLGLFPNQDNHLGPLAAAFVELSLSF